MQQSVPPSVSKLDLFLTFRGLPYRVLAAAILGAARHYRVAPLADSEFAEFDHGQLLPGPNVLVCGLGWLSIRRLGGAACR
jgi:hypothetical protein